MKKQTLLFLSILLWISSFSQEKRRINLFPSPTPSEFLLIKPLDLKIDSSFSYSKFAQKYTTGYNCYILQAIDSIQAKFRDGGGYFTGIKANPPESPIGYDLQLLGKEVLKAPRSTSYCSGASYTAFIESLNLIMNDSILKPTRHELMRMQEPDGSRRNDGVKFWGVWNSDGYGSFDALVEYSQMGKKIKPEQAIPGDFMNISWKTGIGHSVVFLGWLKIDGVPHVAYWSSQKSTNGLGLDIVKIERIKDVCIVRLTNPENLFNFTPKNEINHTQGDVIELP